MAKYNSTEEAWGALIGLGFIVLLQIGFFIACCMVAWHFISKFW